MDNRSPFIYIFLISMWTVQGTAQTDIDIHGHRGCRGLMPENSMPGFLKAVELGATTLEMDLVVSMDGQLVVSHEPWMSPTLCKHPAGNPVSKSEAKRLNIYQMKYADIQNFDCGSRTDPEFPHQQRMPVVKPTLKMVVRSVQKFAADNKYPLPRYNLELKSAPSQYDLYVPQPKVFVELVVNELRRLGIEEITMLQSFDINILEALNKTEEKKFQISYLVRKGKNIHKHLQKLAFKPDAFSPHFSLMSEKMVLQAHTLGIKIIPWTVNSNEQMDRFIHWGVDGVITDYPDLMQK